MKVIKIIFFAVILVGVAFINISCKDEAKTQVPQEVAKVKNRKKSSSRPVVIKDSRGRIISVGRKEGSKIIYRSSPGKIQAVKE